MKLAVVGEEKYKWRRKQWPFESEKWGGNRQIDILWDKIKQGESTMEMEL